MACRVAFQMERLEAIHPHKSTTLRMMREAARRGYTLFHYTVDRLTHAQGKVVAQAHTLRQDKSTFAYGDALTLDLASVDNVQMRQDPPFDMRYLTATYLLERLPASVQVVNNPTEVRNHPEKIAPLLLPEFIPPTLITQNVEEVQAFHTEHKDIVIKPLYAFGGQGVLRFKTGDSNLGPAVELMLAQEKLPFIAQRYIPQVVEGDTRILLLDGEILGAFRRKPGEGAHRANLSAGGSLHPTKLTARDHAICEALKPILKSKGLFLTGIDVIGEYLTEINVTSAMGFAQLETLYGTNPAKEFWDRLEKTL